MPSCRNYSIQQTLHLASQLPTNNLVLGTMLDYNLRYGLFMRELTSRHSLISWWTLTFINGGTSMAIEGQLCTLLQHTSTLSDNGVLILASINCSHFRWWSCFPLVKRYFKVFLHDLGNKNYQWSRKLFHRGRICQLTLSYQGGEYAPSCFSSTILKELKISSWNFLTLKIHFQDTFCKSNQFVKF